MPHSAGWYTSFRLAPSFALRRCQRRLLNDSHFRPCLSAPCPARCAPRNTPSGRITLANTPPVCLNFSSFFRSVGKPEGRNKQFRDGGPSRPSMVGETTFFYYTLIVNLRGKTTRADGIVRLCQWSRMFSRVPIAGTTFARIRDFGDRRIDGYRPRRKSASRVFL